METEDGQRQRECPGITDTQREPRNVETVCQAAHDLGVKYVTMYAFSTENWNRPEGEVEALMKLLESYLKNCIKTADKNNMRVRVIGDTTRLSERFQERSVNWRLPPQKMTA